MTVSDSSLLAHFAKKLQAGDCKLTPRREHVLRVMLENKDKHLSAEEVYNLVKLRAPETGLATVYRTLELFSEHDIIHGMDFGDGRKRYELVDPADDGHHHHHLICTRCGKIMEVDEDLLEHLEHKISSKYEFQIDDHQLKVFGLCSECQKKKKP